MIPKTSVIEEKENKLKQDFEEFNAYKESEEYNRFLELDEFINSKDFADIKLEINAKKYKGSEACGKENKYKELKKSKRIKTYYQVKDSKELNDYFTFKDSEKLANYEELKQFYTSPEFEEFKNALISQRAEKLKEIKDKQQKYKELKKKYKWYYALKGSSKLENPKFQESEKYKSYSQLEGSEEIAQFEDLQSKVNSQEFANQITEAKNLLFKNTEEYKKLQEYKALKKSSDIKQYFKFAESEKLKTYNELHESQEIADFEDLEAYINSEEFKEEKKYLLTKDKFKLSDEFKQEQEYKELKKSEKLKWFQKFEKQNDFDKLHEWELTFEDTFETGKLDSEKWMTGYYWGENLLNDKYVLANEKQFFTDNNIEISDDTLKIVTKQENIKGKVWDYNPNREYQLPFYEKEFNYTSGLINTGQFFRQQYGLFKAKIKVDHSYPVHHAFWLRGEQITPEIDVFKYGKKSGSKIELANFWNEGENKKSIGGPNFAKDYFIYSLEWTPEKLVWKINDFVIYEQTQGIPNEAMYIVLSSGILHEGQVSGSTMEVDWVRAYTKKS